MFSKIFPKIHAEGYKFLIIAGVITLVLYSLSDFFGLIGLVITIWVYYFFRDPERVIIDNDNFLVSPADGEVIKVEEVDGPKELVYAFVCVSFLADGEVDESEKEAMRGNVKVMLPNVSDDEYNKMEAEVIDKFIDLGDENARMNQYGVSLEALKDVFTSDEDRFKVVKNLAYIARADDFIHENEMAMVEKAVSSLDMVDKVNLVKTDSTLFVDPTF